MKRVVKLATVMTIALALNACSDSSETSRVAAAAPVARPAPPVSLSAPPPDDSAFVASGPIVVENQVDVAALREGVIVSILAEPNTRVRKGQLLARLDDRQISADLDAAAAKTRSIQANLKNWEAETKVLESDLSRAQKLWEAGVFTKETLEHAQYKVEADRFEISRETELLSNAKSTEKSLELEKEKTRITAPFDGIVDQYSHRFREQNNDRHKCGDRQEISHRSPPLKALRAHKYVKEIRQHNHAQNESKQVTA